MMGFWITTAYSASIMSIAALGLFLQVRSGQLNVGMAVFLGIGSCISGALSVQWGLLPALSIPAGAATAFVVGCIFSALTLRLHHWFFAVTTLTLSVAAVSIVSQISFFGGAVGLAGIPLVTNPLIFLGALAFSIVIVLGVNASALGLAVRATGDDQSLAAVFGVRVNRLRVLVFGIGSGLAGLAGALQAHRFGVYQPTDFGFHVSLLLLIYVLVGGKQSVWGPLLGTYFLYMVPELIHLSPNFTLAVFGGLLIVVANFMPGGLAGAIQSTFQTLRTRRKSDQQLKAI